MKNEFLNFIFEDEEIKQHFALNISDVSHYYFTEDNGDEYPALMIYFKGIDEPKKFFGGNAGVIADALLSALTLEAEIELPAELEYDFGG